MATKKKATAPVETVEQAPVTEITAFKGFDKNLACRGFQYEVGKRFDHIGRVEACSSGFHSCETPFDVFNYYPMSAGNRFCVVKASGTIGRHADDSKIASASLLIEAELTVPEFIKRGVAWIVGAAKGNVGTGNSGHAAATGDRGHAAATGYRGHAAATGYRGHAAATGYRGHAAATGDSGHAAATGDRGHAAATGDSGIAASLGQHGTATAGASGAIMLAYWNTDVWPYKLEKVGAFMVGQDGVEAGKTYRLNADGKPVVVQP